jgi:hypothetical protein
MARRLTVHYWVRALGSRVQPPAGPNNPYDLFGISYVHPVPAGAGPFDPIERVDMFARFFNGRGIWVFEIDIVWVDAPHRPRVVERYWPLQVHFRHSEPVRDFVFVLRNIPVPGLGRYRILLRAMTPFRRRPLATDYYEVAQP